MADKKEKDVREVDQPKAPNLFDDKNKLNELLDDLDDYETVSQHEFLFFNSDKDGRMEKIPHEELGDADKAKKKANEEGSSLKPPMHMKPNQFGKTINFDKKVDLPQPEENVTAKLFSKEEMKEKGSQFIEEKKIDNLYDDINKLNEILKDYDAYSEWLGINKYTGEENPVNIHEFPYDDKKKAI